MNETILSFCIPTFNRADCLLRLVKDILQCSDPRIEVVISDNASTDDTLGVLRAIKDERLSIYTNSENIGALFNSLNALEKGKGRYIMYSTDKDRFNADEIIGLVTFLSNHPEIGGGFCESNSQPVDAFEVIPKGFKAVQKIAYKTYHPTGYFFNSLFMKEADLYKRFSDINFIGWFGLDFDLAELCLMGDGVIYRRSLVRQETSNMAAKNKSNITAKIDDAFFSPRNRLKIAINFTKHIGTLKISQKEKNILILDIFFQRLASATLEFKAILNNQDLCSHYHIECRKITSKELIQTGIYFYNEFVKETESIWGYNFFERLKFKLQILFQLSIKVLNRAIRHK